MSFSESYKRPTKAEAIADVVGATPNVPDTVRVLIAAAIEQHPDKQFADKDVSVYVYGHFSFNEDDANASTAHVEVKPVDREPATAETEAAKEGAAAG